MGRAGLINSGRGVRAQNDFEEAVATAVINKRAGGTGLPPGAKHSAPHEGRRPASHAIQDVYLTPKSP